MKPHRLSEVVYVERDGELTILIGVNNVGRIERRFGLTKDELKALTEWLVDQPLFEWATTT